MKKIFRPSIAYLCKLFKRKSKSKGNKDKSEMRTNTSDARPATTTTTTTSGGSQIPPASSECYVRGQLWRSWSLVHPSSSSSSEKGEGIEAERGQGELAQSAQCAAKKNKNKKSQAIEAWWVDPALLQVDPRCSGSTVAAVVGGSRGRGRVVQGEGAWWTEPR